MNKKWLNDLLALSCLVIGGIIIFEAKDFIWKRCIEDFASLFFLWFIGINLLNYYAHKKGEKYFNSGFIIIIRLVFFTPLALLILTFSGAVICNLIENTR
ncbi:MAG: hypothetical protein II943_12360 [Victivallales bacterium]|nr:hypothetical protein [Victivallales bacterium]